MREIKPQPVSAVEMRRAERRLGQQRLPLDDFKGDFLKTKTQRKREAAKAAKEAARVVTP